MKLFPHTKLRSFSNTPLLASALVLALILDGVTAYVYTVQTKSLISSTSNTAASSVSTAFPAQIACGIITEDPAYARETTASIAAERCIQSAFTFCFSARVLYHNKTSDPLDSGFLVSFDPAPAQPTQSSCSIFGWTGFTNATGFKSSFTSFPCTGIRTNKDMSATFYGCGKTGDIVIPPSAVEIPSDND